MRLPVAHTPPQLTPMEEALVRRFTVAHQLFVQPDGLLVPVAVTEYLNDPEKPLAVAYRILNGNRPPGAKMTRMRYAPTEPTGLHPECLGIEYVSLHDPTLPFNMTGSLLAALHGREMFPLHGSVVAMRVPDANGVRRKLTIVQKQQIEGTVTIVNAVLRGQPVNVPPHVIETVQRSALVMQQMEDAYREGTFDFTPETSGSAAPAPVEA